ncbi:MAG: YggT family protein [Gammaproteobacteria bacterium]|nr:YggT family protein [Gammaproteobacteria bacterium]
MGGPLLFIVDFAVSVFALFCLLRFLLHLAGANFYSPIVNSIMRITDPVLNPVRKLLPVSRRLDLASLLATLVLETASVYIRVLHAGVVDVFPLWAYVWNGAVSAVQIAIWVYLVAILASVIMSWVAPTVYSPLAEVAKQLADPFLAPLRKMLPPMAGFDFSPMLGMLVLLMGNSYIVPLLKYVPQLAT